LSHLEGRSVEMSTLKPVRSETGCPPLNSRPVFPKLCAAEEAEVCRESFVWTNPCVCYIISVTKFVKSRFL